VKKLVNFFGLLGLALMLYSIVQSGAFSKNRSGNVELDGSKLMQGVGDGLSQYTDTLQKQRGGK
jgi:hypothetical protein